MWDSYDTALIALLSVKKKVRSGEKKQKISITFIAAAEGEQNQWKEHTY